VPKPTKTSYAKRLKPSQLIAKPPKTNQIIANHPKRAK